MTMGIPSREVTLCDSSKCLRWAIAESAYSRWARNTCVKKWELIANVILRFPVICASDVIHSVNMDILTCTCKITSHCQLIYSGSSVKWLKRSKYGSATER